MPLFTKVAGTFLGRGAQHLGAGLLNLLSNWNCKGLPKFPRETDHMWF